VQTKTIHVVAGLISRARRVLVCQRSKTAEFPLKWEFPGGKLEEGEDGETALRRELREELDIEVEESREIFRHLHRYPTLAVVHLQFYRVHRYRGQLRNRVFEQILWLESHELAQLDFLEGDAPLIERLSRPDSAGLLF
jgi:8-oxo-dGTP diphosphatase